jgi:hypothetical protein
MSTIADISVREPPRVRAAQLPETGPPECVPSWPLHRADWLAGATEDEASRAALLDAGCRETDVLIVGLVLFLAATRRS